MRVADQGSLQGWAQSALNKTHRHQLTTQRLRSLVPLEVLLLSSSNSLILRWRLKERGLLVSPLYDQRPVEDAGQFANRPEVPYVCT